MDSTPSRCVWSLALPGAALRLGTARRHNLLPVPRLNGTP